MFSNLNIHCFFVDIGILKNNNKQTNKQDNLDLLRKINMYIPTLKNINSYEKYFQKCR